MLKRKIKKFIFHPIRFFKDSKWFSKPKFYNESLYGSIVFLTTLGQLNQIQVLFKLKNIKNATLVILYTPKNLSMPQLVYNNVDNSIFRSVYYFELPIPSYLENMNQKYFGFLQRGYKSILRKTRPTDIYVMSFSGHYSILLSEATKGNIRTHLVEEGTGTYAPLADYYDVNLSKIEKFKLRTYLSEKGYFQKFDSVNLSFPEMARSIFFAKKYNFFFSHISGINVGEETLKLSDKYSIRKEDYIYVSQEFAGINPEIYYSEIISILTKLLENIDGRIFIKLHPREMKSSKILNILKNKVLSNKRLILFNEPAFLIDSLIYVTEPKGVVGITSSALVYTPLISPTTHNISIVNLLLDFLGKKGEDTQIIKNHLDILKLYNSVQFLEDDFVIRQSKELEGGVNKKLQQMAEKAYRNNNNYLAIFYWQQACNNDIRLLGEKALWYYNALYKQQQYYKMKKTEIDYINSITLKSDKDGKIWKNIKYNYLKNKVGEDSFVIDFLDDYFM